MRFQIETDTYLNIKHLSNGSKRAWKVERVQVLEVRRGAALERQDCHNPQRKRGNQAGQRSHRKSCK